MMSCPKRGQPAGREPLRRVLKAVRDKEQRRELVRYLISGVLTTLVDILTHAFLISVFGKESKSGMMLMNTAAFTAAILFAFVISRRYVFRSENPICSEFVRFFASRLLISFLFNNGGFWLFYYALGWQAPLLNTDILWAKIVAQFFVVAGNYVVGKLFVFHKQTKSSGNSEAGL